MPSISKEPNGRRLVQFMLDKKRKTLRLGKVSQHFAESFCRWLEKLLAAKLLNQPIDSETAQWLNGLNDRLYGKLAAVKLVLPREPVVEVAVGKFLDDLVASRVDVKPATLEVWSQTVRNLKECFGSRLLASVTEDDAKKFKEFLQREKLASTTISKRLQFARTFFAAAVERGLIEVNPFAKVRAVGVISKDKLHFVTVEEFKRLIEVCDPIWRTLFALLRWCGLRCPSEVLSLKWADVDWSNNRIVVSSPKTERHAGKECRTIPIFEELRPYLEDARALAPPNAVYVVGGNYLDKAITAKGWRNINLHTHAKRLLKRAGLKAWPRLFHNFRSTRETELMKRFSIHVVTAWLGNSPKIALKHYLQVTDQDFEAAAGLGAANSEAAALQNSVQQATAASRDDSQKRRKPLDNQGLTPSLAIPCIKVPGILAERAGNHEASRRNHQPRVANDCSAIS